MTMATHIDATQRNRSTPVSLHDDAGDGNWHSAEAPVILRNMDKAFAMESIRGLKGKRVRLTLRRATVWAQRPELQRYMRAAHWLAATGISIDPSPAREVLLLQVPVGDLVNKI